ncbi:MAG: CPBP family intramembrane metalloprotease [Candidatus Omnitrophica bacterium]|nr:CPBP family intramembrane metalloprotease [Candidatus Omnitrophota bacterium]
MKAFVKIFAFVFVFAAFLATLHYGVQFLFQKDAGLLLHHGTGQVTFYLFFVLLVFLFQKYVNREPFSSLGLRAYSGWYVTLLKGWAAGAIAFVGYSLLMGAFGAVVFTYRPGFGRLVTAFVVAFSGFTIALTEEIMFRGFFLQTLLKDLPKWIAVTVTGLIFVVFHDLANPLSFFTQPRQMMLAGGLFSLNLLLCMAYLKTRSLFLPVGIHSGILFAKIFSRKMKMIGAGVDSYWLGLEADARRGFLAWIFFILGIFILNYLITEREKRGTASVG